jgi:hypothetical protein
VGTDPARRAADRLHTDAAELRDEVKVTDEELASPAP